MRWKSRIRALTLLLAAAAGCKQRIFMTEPEFNNYAVQVPANLTNNPNVGAEPTIPPVEEPEDLNNLDRFKVRYLSLAEAVATALEQGTVGQPSLLFPGVGLDNEVVFTGRGTSGSDSIRVLAMDPATIGAEIEQAISKFDTIFFTQMQWTTTDQPIGTTQQTFQAQGAIANGSALNANQTEAAQFQSGLLKPLPTGGVAGITFTTNYTYTNLPARVNPSYQPQLQFQFEQPLLQNYGVEINQLRPTHPGSFLNPQVFGFSGVPNYLNVPEGILITRIRFNQQRAEFERNVNQMLLNVETAYWNLYGAYWTLYSREQGLRFAFETWKVVKAKYEAGREPLDAFAQAQGQYEQFRAQRLAAIDTVLDDERQLRALMGLQMTDGYRLVPADAPTLAAYRPDWHSALDTSLKHRPELYTARQDVKANQMNVQLAKNALLPDLRFTATYDANSLGSRLDGPGQDNAFRNLASNTFNDWAVGLRLNIPIGYRAAHANLRQAHLQLARAYLVLQDMELKTERFLGLQYRRLSSTYKQIQANRAQREAFGVQLQVRYERYLAGAAGATLDTLLEAQRFWADALSQEYQAIVGYNNALCGFEFAKGTILQHDNVHIAEGALPACVQARAVEHYRQRSKAIVLGTRAEPTGTMAQPLQPAGPINLLPRNRPLAEGTTIQDAWQERPPLGKVGELPPAGAPVPPGAKVGPEELLPPPEVVPPTTPGNPVPPSAPAPMTGDSLPMLEPSSYRVPRTDSGVPTRSFGQGQPLLPLPSNPQSSR